MIYAFFCILFAIGMRSILLLIYRQRRMRKVEKLINFSSKKDDSKNILSYGSNLIESQLDKTFKKNSKIISA